MVFAETSNATGALLTGGGGGGGETGGEGDATGGDAGVEFELPPPQAASTIEKKASNTIASSRIMVSPISSNRKNRV